MALPKITLRTSAKMPMMGLGTWKIKPNEVKQAVVTAIDAGYRHFDCAYDYENEGEVGEAIQAVIKEGKVKRQDLFVTSKLWLTFFAPSRVRSGFMESLKMLKLDYLDLFLLHWPFAQRPKDLHPETGSEGDELEADDETDYVSTWKELIKLREEGLVTSIGVSNFNKYQIERLMSESSVPPAVNQFECHPYLDQGALVKYCQENSLVVTGYSPFGSPDSRTEGPDLFSEPLLQKIAEKHDRSVAQVLLRYQIQRDIVVIPKSSTPSHIVSNAEVFDFSLSDEDMSSIRGLDKNWRAIDVDGWASREHKYYPFRTNYSE